MKHHKSVAINTKLKESEFRLKQHQTIKEREVRRNKQNWEEKQEIINQIKRQTE